MEHDRAQELVEHLLRTHHLPQQVTDNVQARTDSVQARMPHAHQPQPKPHHMQGAQSAGWSTNEADQTTPQRRRGGIASRAHLPSVRWIVNFENVQVCLLYCV